MQGENNDDAIRSLLCNCYEKINHIFTLHSEHSLLVVY